MSKLKRPAYRVLCLLAVVGLLGAAEIDPNRYLEHVKYLASPELAGRGAGTEGLEKAAAYIARQFRSLKLQPLEGADYLQPFPVTTNAHPGPGNRFEYAAGGESRALKAQGDFAPFNFSASGGVSGAVVFAGYGITAPEHGYDDYAGLDVKGKLVLILRHEPQETDEKSVFAGKLLTAHAQFWSKAVNAKQHGAAGVILINDLASHQGESDELEKFGRTAGPANAGIVFVQMKAEAAERWLASAGKKLTEIQAAIDKDLKPQSFALPESLQVKVAADVQREVRTVHNVGGFLPGETAEYIVIGAHYDHLGLDTQFSMAPSEAGKPHLGADDNASGTAGVLELARWFSSQPKQKRGILFLAFAGEELGLLGSRYYVDNPKWPIENAVAMINMDMIGRLRGGKVYIGGTATGATFKDLLNRLMPRHKLTADFSGSFDAGSSDHTSFITKQVPVLFFFSGLHADYHKPSDTWDKIDAPAAAELLRAVGDVAAALLSDPGRPQFVKVAQPPAARGAGGPGYGAYFGSIPDFTEIPNGVRFADVREGSPAQKADLRAGDILVEWDGKPIQNLYDFTYALRAKKPGEEAVVKVLRGSETIQTTVRLEQRK
ncbi:MAG: M20/M25/M40 family metallo-hydrolase [Acidobacteriota bacterium]